jgi:hypothetical protein
MSDGENEVELPDESILKPATIKVSIGIKPVIYLESPQVWSNTPVWHCCFEISLGRERIQNPILRASGTFTGEPGGPGWQETTSDWQRQYDYIRRHIGAALFMACEGVIEESRLPQDNTVDWYSLWNQLESTLRPLRGDYEGRELDAYGTRNYKPLKFLDASCRALRLAEWSASHLFMRLTGRTYLNYGSSKDLRFSPHGIGELARCYGAYQAKWNVADSVRSTSVGSFEPKDDEEKWKEVKTKIRQTCGDMPDDLLDELRLQKHRRLYEPYQLGIAHAARDCGFYKAGPRQLEASNWRIISDELQAYARSIGEPIIEQNG